jgi:hypothetical protein
MSSTNSPLSYKPPSAADLDQLIAEVARRGSVLRSPERIPAKQIAFIHDANKKGQLFGAVWPLVNESGERGFMLEQNMNNNSGLSRYGANLEPQEIVPSAGADRRRRR